MADDAESVTLAIVVDGKSLADATLDAPALNDVLVGLASARKGLREKIPESLDPVPRIDTTEHPNWWVFDPTPQGRTLALRHPGYGWLAFLLAPERAVEIAKWLQRAKEDDPKPS